MKVLVKSLKNVTEQHKQLVKILIRSKLMKVLVKSLKNATEQHKQPVKLFTNEVILN